MARFFNVLVVSLCFGHVWAKTKDEYFLLGQTLVMRPAPDSFSPPIDNVEWRHEGNIAAEWSKLTDKVDIYRNFKDRTTLNTSTGALEIINMSEKEAGKYTVEINSNRLDVEYMAKAIEKVQKPEFWARPRAPPDDLELDVDCRGDVSKAGPVTYWWDLSGNGTWVQLDQKIVLKNNETTQKVKMFSCKISNPVSEKESDPKENPFYKPEPGSSAAGAAVGGVLGVLLLCAIIVAGVGYMKGWFKNVCVSKEAPVSPENNEIKNLRDEHGNAATASTDQP